MACPGVDSSQRTYIHDPSLSGAQMGQRFSRNQERSACIGLEDFVPGFQADLFQRRGLKDCGVVHQQIKPPEYRCDRMNNRADGILGTHVTFHSQRPAVERSNLLKRLGGVCV